MQLLLAVVCSESLLGGASTLCSEFLSLGAHAPFRSRRAGVQVFCDQVFTEVRAPFEETLLQRFHEA